MFENINHLLGLLLRPQQEWEIIAQRKDHSWFNALSYTALLAFLPAFAWYYGTTNVGWTVGDGEAIKLTKDSALVLIALFYFVMIGAICGIGYMIHWMSITYGSKSSHAKGMSIAAYSATPLFLAGAVGLLPVLWVSLIVSVTAVSYAVYLLYLGIPAVMSIPKERGFLFASAVIAVCLVILMMIMGGSVILWDLGAAPNFTD